MRLRLGWAALALAVTVRLLSAAHGVAEELEHERTVLRLRLLSELACPYAAAYLTDLGHHLRLRHWVNVVKMEEVFFNTIGSARYKFQLQNPNDFFGAPSITPFTTTEHPPQCTTSPSSSTGCTGAGGLRLPPISRRC